MLRRLFVHNLRCLVNFELDLTELPSALIVGRNGVGKSSIIDALEIISSIALGRTSFKEVLPRAIFSNFSEEGKAQMKVPPLRFELEAEIGKDVRASYHIEFEWPTTFDEPRVRSEQLAVNGQPVFSRERSDTKFYPSEKANATSFPLDWHTSAVSGIQEPHDKHPLRLFKNWLSNVVILRPVPQFMKGVSSSPTRALSADGRNIADWYRWIVTHDSEQGYKINSYLRQVWPEFKTIRNDQLGPDVFDLHLEFSDGNGDPLRIRLENLSQGEKILFLWATLLAWSETNSYSLCAWDEVADHVALVEIQDFLRGLRNLKGPGMQFLATGHLSEVIRSFAQESTVVLRRSSRTIPTQPPRLASTLDFSDSEELAVILARGEEL